MNTLIFILAILILLAIGRHLYHRYLEIKFKYTLYKLRDRVRFLCVEDKLKSSDWIFNYFDLTISKTINESYSITLFTLISLDFINNSSEDKKLQNFSEKFEKATDEVPELIEIKNDFIQAIKNYTVKQHFVTELILTPIVGAIIGTRNLKSKLNKWSKDSLVFPETSVSDDFLSGSQSI